MRFRLARMALALAFAALAIVALGSAAQAQGPDLPTFLTIQPIDTIPGGTTLSISVRLTTGRGDPVAATPDELRRMATPAVFVAGREITPPAGSVAWKD